MWKELQEIIILTGGEQRLFKYRETSAIFNGLSNALIERLMFHGRVRAES